jgi:hypothetical protein
MNLDILKKPKLMALGAPLVLMSQCGPQQCAPAPAPAALSVTHVVDGDTLDLSNGERVRLVGIDAPEAGTCGAAEATARLGALVANKTVAVQAGARDDRDGYGRLLRYVDTGNVDAGRVLIGEGLAIARYDSRDGYGSHPREADYVALDAATPNVCAGADTIAGLPPASNCHPAYVECLAVVGDLDCAQIGHLVHLRSIGNDPYRLDGSDNDGLGCETF